MELTFCLQEIETTAREFLAAANNYKTFALHGNLAAGKTTFIRAVCSVLRVKDHVTSPTFNIIHTYHADNGKIIYHLDLYRVKDSAEAINAGVEECLYSGELCFVEWPEKVFDILPLETVEVFLSVIDESHRKLEVK